MLARILAGGRVSLLVALGGVGGAALLGAPLGLACGFLGGWTDRVAMRCMDVLLAFPGILLALGITAALGASAATLALADRHREPAGLRPHRPRPGAGQPAPRWTT